MRDNQHNNYLHSSSLLLLVAVAVFLSLGVLFPNYIHAQNQSIRVTAQDSTQIGVQQKNSQNGTGKADFANTDSNEENLPLIMTTDKTVYSPGETVNITISNTGEAPLTFPNAALGLTIRNVATNQTYPIFSAQVITVLNPNDSRSVTWGPISSNGSKVPPGDYVASLSSGASTEDVTFLISK
jgi:uncharacterized membrane protein